MQQALKFKPKEKQLFVGVLRERINNYFKSQKYSVHANVAMVLRTLFCVTLWAGTYCLLIFGGFSVGVNYLLWAVFGVSVAWVTINVGHDAIHGAYSKRKWAKKLLSHTFNLNGASAYMWGIMHNVAHHTYTNVQGYDEDITPIPVLRLSPWSECKKMHKHQYWYSFFFYGLATLSWVFIKDYVKFFSSDVGNYNGSKHPKKELFYLFFYKFVFYTLIFVIPFIMIEHAWYYILTGIILSYSISGAYLAIVFMMAHAVESVQFPLPNQEGDIENTWAVHQLYTTANFQGRSMLMGFLTGGLNTQVEHHLFPHVSSIHYRHLSKIVEDTAKEFELPYFNYPTFWSAFKSHIRFLKKMGRKENYKPVYVP